MEIKLVSLAYCDIVCHLHRFNHDGLPEKDRQMICGLISGFVENGSVVITKYLPLTHSSTQLDFELNHHIFKYADKFNTEHHDPNNKSDEILGFVRSSPSDVIDIGMIDRKNLLYFQTAYSEKSMVLVLDSTGDQFTMQFKHYNAPVPELDEDSELEEVTWNFQEIDDLDELFKKAYYLQENREKKLPLIKEVNEK